MSQPRNMMKYFTPDGWIADQDLEFVDPESVTRRVREYKAYLDSISHQLPSDLRRLLAEFCLHDGRLRDLTLDVAQSIEASQTGFQRHPPS